MLRTYSTEYLPDGFEVQKYISPVLLDFQKIISRRYFILNLVFNHSLDLHAIRTVI